MTTEQQTTPEGEWVPRYFSDFRREFDVFKDENVRQHVQLGERIGALEVDTARQFGEVKTDIESKFGEIKAQMADDRTQAEARFGRIDREFGELKAQMAHDKAEMHRALASQLRWMIGTTAGVGIAVVTSVVYLAERVA